jgi:hypothetical protein
LLDQVRECVLYNHYSLKKEKILLLLVFFILCSATLPSGMRHPRKMDVSASTHNQALSALLFLYREVLGIDLP